MILALGGLVAALHSVIGTVGQEPWDRRDVFYCIVRALCRGDDFLRKRERSSCPQFSKKSAAAAAKGA